MALNSIWRYKTKILHKATMCAKWPFTIQVQNHLADTTNLACMCSKDFIDLMFESNIFYSRVNSNFKRRKHVIISSERLNV